jgi:hypothetical protein
LRFKKSVGFYQLILSPPPFLFLEFRQKPPKNIFVKYMVANFKKQEIYQNKLKIKILRFFGDSFAPGWMLFV